MKGQYFFNQSISGSTRFNVVILLFIPALFALSGTPSDNNEKMLIKSMGLPKVWKPYGGPMFSMDHRTFNGKPAAEFNLGVYRDLANPILGLIGITGEGYVRFGDRMMEAGARFLASCKVFYMNAGIDYALKDAHIRFLLSIQSPVWRGGPFGQGGCVRFDWIPGANNTYGIGLNIPLAQPFMGKTRPRKDRIKLPRKSSKIQAAYVPDPMLQDALTKIRKAAYWINQFTMPVLDENVKVNKSHMNEFRSKIDEMKNHIHQTDSLYLHRHTFQEEVRVFHEQMERAFALCIFHGEPEVNQVRLDSFLQRVREIVFDEVILPYNRLIGQYKRRDSVKGLGARASEIFEAWLKISSDIPAKKFDGVKYVFFTLIDIIEENRAISRHHWGDSRLVWIPCHYALRSCDHDTESEMDAILEKALKQKFTDANDVHYVINEMFQPELERMVLQTEDYHILWVHDYQGLDKAGNPDAISFRQSLSAYLQALIHHVRTYDEKRKIPMFFIFLDQHYYELNHGKIWMKLLQNPLEYHVNLSKEFQAWEFKIKQAQNELWDAINKSQALQDDIKLYGTKWLKNRIKVHVNITNPSDLSFRSGSLIQNLAFVPDNVMRDHRKITFYDITEFNPGKGEAMFSGQGVGEHYVGPTWDERSIIVRGPVLLSLKAEARALLLSQGFKDTEIPEPLQPFPKPGNYETMLNQLRESGWNAVAMQVHNTTGFGNKSANIVKSILYTLMPPGSHIFVPDPLWNSPFWGSMLVGAALRGCTVLVVSPALENAPSYGKPQMSRANDLFTRFVMIQNEMQNEIESEGGLFKVGIYNMDLDVGDVIGKVKAINNGIAKEQLFYQIFPFDSTVFMTMAEMPEILEAKNLKPQYLAEDATPRKPNLHFKIQFFASEHAIQSIVPDSAWAQIVRKYIIIRAKQTAHDSLYADVKMLRAELEEEAETMMREWGKSVDGPERDKSMIYLTVGSQNEDYRSMIMDGEALFVTGHAWAMIAYLDFVSLMGQTTWIHNVDQLNQLLPRHSEFWQRVGRFLKLGL